jgi:polysaccharide export outer membrane protein
MVIFASGTFGSEYILASGDTVEINIAGPIGVSHKSVVDIDGEISLPLSSSVKAKGLSLSDLRNNVKAQLTTRTFRKHSADGSEMLLVPDAEEISVDVVEYRPIYIIGDVAKPGQQTYRPGMTALQAITLAAGYDVLRLRMENPYLLAADLRGSHERLIAEISQLEAKAARLRAQKSTSANIDFQNTISSPLLRGSTEQLVNLEREQFDIETSGFKKEQESLEKELQLTGNRIAALTKQQERQEAGIAEQESDLTRLRGLAERALVTTPRFLEAQRLLSLSSERFFQTVAETERVKVEREAQSRQQRKLHAQRGLALTKELEDCVQRIFDVKAQLRATDEKLIYTGVLQSQLTGTVRPRISVIRSETNGSGAILVDENFELRPGDVLSIELKIGERVSKVSNYDGIARGRD